MQNVINKFDPLPQENVKEISRDQFCFSFAVFHSPEKKKKSLILIHGMDDKIKFFLLFVFLLGGGVYVSSYFTEKIFKEVICQKYSWYNYVFSHLFFRITFCFHFIWGCTYKTILTNTDTSLTSILKQKPRLEWADMHITMLHRHYVSMYNSSCNLCCKSVVCKICTIIPPGTCKNTRAGI